MAKFYFDAPLAQTNLESWATAELYSESLENLKKLIPTDIDFEVNEDLFPIAFPVGVANLFNKNGEGIDSHGALSLKNSLVHKFTDIEHDRSTIVGHIVAVGFTKFNSDHEFLTDEEVADMTEPFNIVAAAVLYKRANPSFSREIMAASDDQSFRYKDWSVSWEISFDKDASLIAVGNSRKLSECEIISEEEAPRYFKYLKRNKGRGVLPDGRFVNLILKSLIGVGVGYTKNPASFVKGTITKDIENDITDENFSESTENGVKQNKSIMDEKLLETIKALIDEAVKNAAKGETCASESFANISNVFSEIIRKGNDEWKQKLDERDRALAQKEEGEKALIKSVEELRAQLASTQSELDAMRQERAISEATELFNARFTEIENLFELNDDARKVIASELVALDNSDEAFASYTEKLKVFMSSSLKSEKQSREESIANEVSARVKELLAKRGIEVEDEEITSKEVEESLASAKEISPEIPNSLTQPETLKQKFKKAFTSENIKISL